DGRQRFPARQSEPAIRLRAVLDGERDVLQKPQRKIVEARRLPALELELQLVHRYDASPAADASAVDRGLHRRVAAKVEGAAAAAEVGDEYGLQLSPHLGRRKYGGQVAVTHPSEVRLRPGDLGFDLRSLVQSAPDAPAALHRLNPAPARAPHAQRHPSSPQVE